jgi:hypothetical protein
MVDPNQVSNRFEDGLCPCRGCTTARKRVLSDFTDLVKKLYQDDEKYDTVLNDVIDALNTYKENM